MPLTVSRRAKWLATTVVVLLLLAFLFGWPRPVFQLTLAAVRYAGNGVLRVTVVLTNGTHHPFDIADDADGNPAFLLDDGSATGDTYGTWVKPLANQHKVRLAPGASLTHALWLTNPPPRFRLRVDALDLAKQGRGFPLYRIIGRGLAGKMWSWRRKLLPPQVPSSVWIERESFRE